jgi:hypothetical protein
MDADTVLRIRDMVDHAYEHEAQYCELNRAGWDRYEVMAALSTLNELHLAEKNTHEVWMELAWRRRRGFQVINAKAV